MDTELNYPRNNHNDFEKKKENDHFVKDRSSSFKISSRTGGNNNNSARRNDRNSERRNSYNSKKNDNRSSSLLKKRTNGYSNQDKTKSCRIDIMDNIMDIDYEQQQPQQKRRKNQLHQQNQDQSQNQFATAQFPKLNKLDPVHLRRMQQRRRAVSMGKNTIGYDEYIRKIPKHKRVPRSMDCPATPDHTLDIPAKRWQGLLKAWRVSLHRYDPPDLLKAFNETTENNDKSKDETPVVSTPKKKSIQEQQLEEAHAKGLLVDLPTIEKTNKFCSPISVQTETSTRSGTLSLMDDERGLGNNDNTGNNVHLAEDDDANGRWGDLSDSDDDLL